MMTDEQRKAAIAATKRRYYLKNLERVRERGRARYLAKREHIKKRGKASKDALRKTRDGRASLILQYARNRALRRRIAFEIDVDWVTQQLNNQRDRCAMSGIPFVYDAPLRDGRLPSLDRIDPGQGYTEENTRVVCWMWNASKGMASDAQVIEFARAVVDFWGNI